MLGFPGGSAGKESGCNVRDLCSNTGLGRSPEEGNGSPLQYSGLERQTKLSDFHWNVKSMIQGKLDVLEQKMQN